MQVVSSWLKTDSRPPYHKIGKYSYVVKSLWSQWDNLKVNDGVLYRVQSDNDQLQVLVPMKERRRILRFAHDTKNAAHLGIKKTLSWIREKFYWSGVRGDTWSYISDCENCNKRKQPIPKRKAPMQVQQSGYPMERIAIDILGELPETDSGNRYIVVISD